MLISILFIIVGFIFLVLGADRLVEGSSSLAKKIGVSDLIIGLTIVAFGTSAPELIVNLSSVYTGATDIAIGNIIGSNIVNVCIILGISAIFTPIIVKKTLSYKDIPFAILSSLIVFILGADMYFKDSISFVGLDKADGLILIAFFCIFLYYIFSEALFARKKDNSLSKDDQDDNGEVKVKVLSQSKSVFFIVIGLIALVLGGKLVVDGAIDIAKYFNISEMLIGLTIVAIGTSLPELFTSVTAARRGNSDIAIGNVIGSNIFNVFFILGLTSLLSDLPIKSVNIFDMFVNIFVSLLVFVFLFVGSKHKIDRWQGILFISLYIIYVALIMFRG